MKINLEEFRVRPGARVKLKRYDAGYTGGFKSRAQADERLEKGLERMLALQELLYAENRYSLLLIFQAVDAAGKDSAIKHVMSGLNPQGTQVTSFKVPSAEELDHDYMWRAMRALPERGRIGVFNRSYYEEVLVVRVHPEVLAGQHLPAKLVSKRVWEERFQDIRAIERYLARNGTIIRKFFLHVSKREQRRRFLERLDEPEKNWKFSAADVQEREKWNDYVRAYEEALSATSTDHAPWYIIPADHKWFTQLVIAEVIVDTLERLKLRAPEMDAAEKRELAKARRWLQQGKPDKSEKPERSAKKDAKARRRAGSKASARASAHEETPAAETGDGEDEQVASPVEAAELGYIEKVLEQAGPVDLEVLDSDDEEPA